MTKPLTITVHATTQTNPGVLCNNIIDMEQWKSFTGWGPLPGISNASFELRTDEIVGSRIRAHNTDGSTHIETITVWDPKRCIELTMGEFPKPLSRLATSFTERWTFSPLNDPAAGWNATRTLEMHPRSGLTRVLLIPIAFMMKRALVRHNRTVL